MVEGQWYWCLTHKAVEPYEACKSIDRLGPYATREDAAAALATVTRRNDEWEHDPRFDDDDDGDGDPRTHDDRDHVGPF
jgi:hypothetical protein